MRSLHVESARDLGLQFVDNPHRMVGQDGAFSIPLGNESLWFFGDTLIGARVPRESLWFPGGIQLGPEDMSGHGSIEKLHNNTGLLLRDRTGRHGLRDYSYILDSEGGIKQLVPRERDEHPDEIRVWCLHGCVLGERIYLYYLTVRMLAAGPMPVNFELVGAGLAVGKVGEWNFRRIRAGSSTLWWRANLPQFGTTVLPARDNATIYVYGVRKDDAGIQRCALARVPADDIEHLDGYEYFAGSGPAWSPDPRAAVSIMDEMPNEMSVSWNPHLGCYLAVHSLDLTGRIVGRTAPDPWGPWGEPVDLWQVRPPRLDYSIPYPHLIYAGKEHPEIAEDGGRILYITYIEFEEYFPHLVEVTLSNSGGGTGGKAEPVQ